MKGMIGLEIHTYLNVNQKLFCKCKADRNEKNSNINICPICTGQPGAKPMLPNQEAVKKAIQIALALDCKISSKMPWMRKHYSWPDLPKGYQNTLSGAHAVPLGLKGKFQGIRISSMHLEEDPASWTPETGKVDYNRSGLPLVEIVTEPDFVFSDEVVEWLKKLIHVLSYLKAADSNAGIKVDVNVSIPKKTQRVEIKNINSLESVKAAIDYELERQLKEGSVRETRRFDEAKQATMPMRKKEQQDDYRFIQDPDLAQLEISPTLVKDLESKMPELPEQKLHKLIKKHKIPKKEAEILAKNLDIVEFFEQVTKHVHPELALPWITNELLRVLNWNKSSLASTKIQVPHFVKLLDLVKTKKITELQAKQILNKFHPESFDPDKIEGKITDPKHLEQEIIKVIKKNEKAVKDFKSGDKNALNFLLGELMKSTNKRADFKVSLDIFKKLLK